MLVCGVDEAGRGPMIGPLVVAGIAIEKSKIKDLEEIGVKDSKKLAPAVREKLYKKITRLVDDYAVLKVSPKQVDAHVQKHQLNQLEASCMAKIIKKLKPSVSYVDSCDVDAVRFGKVLTDLAKTGKIKSYHRADSQFVVVAAASIIAKVTRDRAITKLNKSYEFGSGYPSDARSVKFVIDWFSKHQEMPEFVRKSWAPVRMVVKNYALT